jgi:hypothetical protein
MSTAILCRVSCKRKSSAMKRATHRWGGSSSPMSSTLRLGLRAEGFARDPKADFSDLLVSQQASPNNRAREAISTSPDWTD